MDEPEKQIQIVTGLVDVHGCGGVQTPPQVDWTASFSFQAWRDKSGLLHNSTLRVSWSVSQMGLRSFMARFQAYRVMKVKLILENEKSAELIEILDENIPNDAELNEIAVELQKPVTFEHERFGVFVLDRRFNIYNAKTNWNGTEIDLELEASEPTDLELALKYAQTMWDDILSWNHRVLDYAAQELLDSVWLEENDKPISADEFKGRMRLESIAIAPEGDFNFWFADGDLFWGHSILICGDFQNGFNRIEVAG